MLDCLTWRDDGGDEPRGGEEVNASEVAIPGQFTEFDEEIDDGRVAHRLFQQGDVPSRRAWRSVERKGLERGCDVVFRNDAFDARGGVAREAEVRA